jgi:hypothetical protein
MLGIQAAAARRGSKYVVTLNRAPFQSKRISDAGDISASNASQRSARILVEALGVGRRKLPELYEISGCGHPRTEMWVTQAGSPVAP